VQKQLFTARQMLAEWDSVSLLKALMGTQVLLKRAKERADGPGQRDARRLIRRIKAELARRRASDG
jgi:hypothetical protein